MKRGFTLVEMMIVVAIIGILAAIAVPNFIKFQAKSKQSEAKTNLKAIFTSEKASFSEKDSYGNFTGIGFIPERGNRYAYTIVEPAGEALSRQAAVDALPTTVIGFDRIEVDCYRLVNGACNAVTVASPAPGGTQAYVAPTISAELGVTAPSGSPGLVRGQSGSVIARAVGNVDNDVGGDVWEVPVAVSLTVPASPCADADPAPTGQPVNTWNDSICE